MQTNEGKRRANVIKSVFPLSASQLQLSDGKRWHFAGNSAELTGHASAETNKGYTHYELKSLRAAIAVIPGVAGK